jgi:hypothetical protein
MGKLHLRNVVFPAVLLSCSIFSTLTLPFVLSDSNPVTVKLPPFFEGEIQPVFTSDNKTFTIRYIGTALVVSVGTGLLTVEVLRRAQKRPQTEVAALDGNSDLAAAEPIVETSFPSHSFDLDAFTPLSNLVEEFAEASHAETSVDLSEASHHVAVLEEQGETCRI